MFSFCLLFSLAMIANVQPAGDGVWFWYATFLLAGKRLYTDMHLVMQPMYVLETAAFLVLLGKGWIVSKVPAVLHAVAYCLGLLLLARRAPMTDRRRAIVLGASFFVSLSFEGYRFDDYHVLADCCQVYSLLLLLALPGLVQDRWRLPLVGALGVLSGIALATRLNDGAALALGVMISLLGLLPVGRLITIAVFCAVTCLTLLAVASLTGDTLHAYVTYSIFHAAASKGGTGRVLMHPLKLPLNTLRFMKHSWNCASLFYAAGAALGWTLVERGARARQDPRTWRFAGLGLLLIAVVARPLLLSMQDITLIQSTSAGVVLLCYGLAIWEMVNLIRYRRVSEDSMAWDRRRILFVVPLGQFASGSMSTAGLHMGLYGPIGITMLLLAICFPLSLRAKSQLTTALAFATLLMVSALYLKVKMPYGWHSYREPPMFTRRVWYQHPVYGPMILDRDLLTFIQPVCGVLDSNGAQRDLLSLPFPYANYFCDVPPWHGYVQTFFDTSSKATIEGLMSELRIAPPRWVLYQRQLENLKGHEQLYNGGQPLPQRYLDQLIQDHIHAGVWQVTYRSEYEARPGWPNTWELIRTDRP